MITLSIDLSGMSWRVTWTLLQFWEMYNTIAFLCIYIWPFPQYDRSAFVSLTSHLSFTICLGHEKIQFCFSTTPYFLSVLCFAPQSLCLNIWIEKNRKNNKYINHFIYRCFVLHWTIYENKRKGKVKILADLH